MRPDKITCQNCGKQIDRGKWCSDKCRMAFKRKEPEQNKPEHEQKVEHSIPEQPESEQSEQDLNLTKADQTFYDRAMRDFGEPYYYFSDVVQEKKCANCNTKFKTSLRLNRYCSYKHYQETLKR